jgi:hypothetical protein
MSQEIQPHCSLLSKAQLVIIIPNFPVFTSSVGVRPRSNDSMTPSDLSSNHQIKNTNPELLSPKLRFCQKVKHLLQEPTMPLVFKESIC